MPRAGTARAPGSRGPVVVHAVILALAGILCLLASIGLVSCGGAAPVPDSSDASMSPGATLDTISWSEAVDSVGQRLRVEGPVASVRQKDGYSELSLGLPSPAPQRFVVIVPDKLKKRFDAPLSDLFGNALLDVTGKVERIDGAVGIRITAPTQLKSAQ